MPVAAPFPELDEYWPGSARLAGAFRRSKPAKARPGISPFASAGRWKCSTCSAGRDPGVALAVPELAGMTLVITGSGRRLRDILQEPTANLGCLVVDKGGRTGQLYTRPSICSPNLTSELNSHLAVHRDQIACSGSNFHAVIHAQPRHLTYLSHIPGLPGPGLPEPALLRWQPETIINLPEGIGFVPFNVPGSQALMSATLKTLHQYRVIVWSKHGVMARSDTSVKRASDRIEYAETAAATSTWTWWLEAAAKA